MGFAGNPLGTVEASVRTDVAAVPVPWNKRTDKKMEGQKNNDACREIAARARRSPDS